MIWARKQLPLQLQSFRVFCILTGPCVPGKCWIISWGLWRRNHIQDTNLLHENLCRICVLSRTNSPHDFLNYCLISSMSKSPITDQSRKKSLKFTWTNISESPIISRIRLPHLGQLTNLPVISSPEFLKVSPAQIQDISTSEHKGRRNNYRP
jgi:hypothetical protein